MHEGRILHIEDSPEIRAVIQEMLELQGGRHRVVAEAPDLSAAISHLEAIKERRLDANVILLDGYLGNEDPGTHAKTVVEHARQLGLGAAIIGLSSSGLEALGLEVGRDIDADINKNDVFKYLNETLDYLPEPDENSGPEAE